MRKKKAPVPPGQPTREVFIRFARDNKIDQKLAGEQWDVWDMGEWCDGNGTPIKNWKLKLAMYAKRGFGMFNPNYRKPPSRAAEAQEEYEERQRYKPKDL